jgi:hypothetical protein
MRIVQKHEIGKLVSLLRGIAKEQITGFHKSSLYPPYLFWNATGSEQSKMYTTIYVTPALLAEAETSMNEPAI